MGVNTFIIFHTDTRSSLPYLSPGENYAQPNTASFSFLGCGPRGAAGNRWRQTVGVWAYVRRSGLVSANEIPQPSTRTRTRVSLLGDGENWSGRHDGDSRKDEGRRTVRVILPSRWREDKFVPRDASHSSARIRENHDDSTPSASHNPYTNRELRE